jgi:hypothetical protein
MSTAARGATAEGRHSNTRLQQSASLNEKGLTSTFLAAILSRWRSASLTY